MDSRHFVGHGFALAMALVASVALPQSVPAQDCTPMDLSATLQPNDKVFDLALELSRDLQRGGFVVRCFLRSRFEGLFEGLAGAALFRTDRGDFEALLLAAPSTFDRLIVRERREGLLWVYSFEGEPKPWPANRMEGRRIQFVKGAHRLLLVFENETLALSLQQVLDSVQRR